MGHSHEQPALPPKVAMLGARLNQVKSIDASQSKLFCSFSELKKVTGILLILPEWLSVVPRRQHQDKAIAFRPRGSAAWYTHWNVRKPQEFSCLPEGFGHISCLRLLCKALGSCKAAVYFLYLKKQKTASLCTQQRTTAHLQKEKKDPVCCCSGQPNGRQMWIKIYFAVRTH